MSPTLGVLWTSIAALQDSRATRAQFDMVKTWFVKRRMRGDDTGAEFQSLAALWRTSPHYDGKD